MMKVVRWLGLLAQDYKRCFMILMTGQCIFFVGIALFYLSAKHYDAQPLLSELVAFFGMLLIVIGVVVALVGYLSLTYGRWYHFFRRSPGSRKMSKQATDNLTEPVVEQTTEQDVKQEAETASNTEHNLVETTKINEKEE